MKKLQAEAEAKREIEKQERENIKAEEPRCFRLSMMQYDFDRTIDMSDRERETSGSCTQPVVIRIGSKTTWNIRSTLPSTIMRLEPQVRARAIGEMKEIRDEWQEIRIRNGKMAKLRTGYSQELEKDLCMSHHSLVFASTRPTMKSRR